jgi:hypothetical protein
MANSRIFEPGEETDEAEQLSSDYIQEQMVDSLLVAVNVRETFRLAQLSGQTDASAVFISPPTRNLEVPPPAKVFTSWYKRKSKYLVPDFVSLPVQPDGTSNKGYQRARTSEWMSGLWFATQKQSFERDVFHWPF